MLSATVPGKMDGRWETMEIRERRVGVCMRWMSIPLRDIGGILSWEVGASYRPRSSDAIVDLPEPDRPTIAVHWFRGMLMDTSRRTCASGRDG